MKQTNSSKEEILKRIKTVRKERSSFHVIEADNKADIYKPILPDAVSCFKIELEAVNGQCFLCDSEEDMYMRLKEFVSQRNFPYLYCRDNNILQLLNAHNIVCSSKESDFESMEAGITTCEFLIARTGSVLVSSASPSGRQMHVFPPVHIVLAKSSQLVAYPEDALVAMQNIYGEFLPSAITTITGPSRTADIEKTLVLGAHGPKEFIVFLSRN